MKRQHLLRAVGVLLILLAATSGPVLAVTVTIDYQFATGNFFDPGTTNGAKARATLQAAADLFSGLLTDTLEGIQTPQPNPYQSSAGGTADWQWTAGFKNPADGTSDTLENLTIAANQYLIFAGVRDLTGNDLGIGGPGSVGYSYDIDGNFSSQGEIDQLEAWTDEFIDDVQTRGETSGFVSWGGSIAFDSVGTTWNYNHTMPPSTGQADLYSVAVHEMAHALGFGASDAWTALVVGNNFNGPVAKSEYGGQIPLKTPQKSHWDEGVMNTALGTSIPQEASMDPTLTQGNRKYFTYLDAAALDDIGWSLNMLDPVLVGDYNGDGKVSAADFTVWRGRLGAGTLANRHPYDSGPVDLDDFNMWQANYGATGGDGASLHAIPEPHGLAMAAIAIALIARRRRTRAKKPPTRSAA